MDRVALVYVPWDSGVRDRRMGRGPLLLRARGLAATLRERGFRVGETVVELAEGWRDAVADTFTLQALTGNAVRAAAAEGAFPIVLSGNCNAGACGVAWGLDRAALGAVWFDAHDDFETPDTTTSGFMDGMALAMLTGRCWPALRGMHSTARPLPGERVALVGLRDASDGARANLRAARVEAVHADVVRSRGPAEAIAPALDRMSAAGVAEVLVHVDLDVLDPAAVAPANGFACPGGLRLEELLDATSLVAARWPLSGASIAAFDPDHDVEDRMAAASVTLALHVAGVAP